MNGHRSAFPLPADSDFMSPGMTLRQYAAIHLRVPNSGDDWLDDMIREAQRNDFAAKAMQSYAAFVMSADVRFSAAYDEIAREAYQIADAMLAARGAA